MTKYKDFYKEAHKLGLAGHVVYNRIHRGWD